MLSSASAAPHKSPEHVVIAGAGIIGTCTAYYLAKNYNIRSTLVDVTGSIAPAASGKAGGFLALDWNDHSPTGPLTRRSFALHQELANELGAESIQYRRLTCAAITVSSTSAKQTRPKGKKLEGIEWAQPPDGDSAVVAECDLRKGKVIGAVHDDRGILVGVKVEQLDENGPKVVTTLQADALLFACGPWTAPKVMTGIKYHSVVVPTDRVLNQCVFFSGCGDPEVYVRPDATAYLTGFPDPPCVVTEQPGQESVRPANIATIVDAVREASSGGLSSLSFSDIGDAKTDFVQQACYLPSTADGIPIMGVMKEAFAGGNNCFVAAGHTCWGILMGPASGEAMADLVATGKSKHVDLEPFSPSRFRIVQPV